MLIRIPRPINCSHTHLDLLSNAMGASHSLDSQDKVGASIPDRVSKKDCLVESTDSTIESSSEWKDLPPLPDTARLQKCHYVLNLKLVGDRFVGKTQLRMRFIEDTYNEGSYWSDIEPDFRTRSITMDERIFKLHIWDYAYDEEDEEIPLSIMCSNPVLYNATSGIFLVYSKQNKASFEKLSELVHVIKKHAPPTVLLTLLGSKCDSKRKVEENECIGYYKAKEFADRHGMAFFEVSAKDGTNVELAVTDMVARIWRTMIEQHEKHSLCSQ